MPQGLRDCEPPAWTGHAGHLHNLWHRVLAPLQLLFPRANIGSAKGFDEGVLVIDSALDLVSVVPVVGQRSVDVRDGDGWKLIDDLVCRLTKLLMQNGDVLDTDAVTR